MASSNPKQPQHPQRLLSTSPKTTRKRRHRLRYQVRPTPWYDSSEFEAVGRGLLRASELFPPDEGDNGGRDGVEINHEAGAISEVASSVRRVALWRCRSEASGGRLPHAVETTASLAEALLTDRTSHRGGGGVHCEAGAAPPLGGSPPSSATAHSLRLSYSAAVIRAVNGLADSLVKSRAINPRGMSTSVMTLCVRMGLPDWIVDLRHEASHNDLPPLPSLRLAAETLLRYFGDRYWDAVGEAMVEVRAAATELVCQIETAAAGRIKMIVEAEAKNEVIEEEPDPEPEPDDDEDEDEKDDGNDEEEAEVQEEGDKAPNPSSTNTFNYFSMLADPPKEKKLKKKPKRSPPPRKKKSAAEIAEERRQERLKNISELENCVPASATRLARQFCRTVPLDVGMSALIDHFVWGGALAPPSPAEGSAESSEGAVSFPATEEGVDRIRKMHSTVLVEIAGAWTGFPHCLLVNIVDCVLAMEDARMARESNAPEAGADDNTNSQVTDETEDQRKLYFLVSWARYLVSRDFHSHFAPDLAVYDDPSTGRPCDLRKKKVWDRTDAESAYMSRPVLVSGLRGAASAADSAGGGTLPLNGLADRCSQGAADARVWFDKAGANASSSTNAAEELLQLFEGALGEKRVEGMGLLRGRKVGGDLPPQKRARLENDSVGAEGACPIFEEEVDAETTVSLGGSDKADDKEIGGAKVTLPRDEPKALQSVCENGAGNEAEGKKEAGTNIKTTTTTKTRQGELERRDKQSTDDEEICVNSKVPTTKTKKRNVRQLSSLRWTLCQSWDACTIGTLPAHPA